MNIRPLDFKNPTDVDQYKKLYSSWLKNYGVTLTDERFWGFVIFYKYESNFVGAFVDDQLVASMRYYRSRMVPYYYVNSLILNQDLYDYNNYDPDHPFVKILDNILETMEAEGRYTWFQSYFYHENNVENPNDLLKHCIRGWDQGQQQLRYERYIEEHIPKNSRSKNSSYQMLLFTKIWPTDINIVHSSLKPEYRKIGDAINDEHKFFV